MVQITCKSKEPEIICSCFSQNSKASSLIKSNWFNSSIKPHHTSFWGFKTKLFLFSKRFSWDWFEECHVKADCPIAVSLFFCMFDLFRFQVLLSASSPYSTILETQAVLDGFKKWYKINKLHRAEGSKGSRDVGGAGKSHSKLNPTCISIHNKWVASILSVFC